MGLSTKCFEILENRPSNYDLRHDGMHADTAYATHDAMMSDDESEATEDEEEEELDDGGLVGPGGEDTESEASDEHDHDIESDDESVLQDSQKGPKLRVREILFYEERVEAFRRRHGVLRP
jgi:hypothetical protein